MPRARNRGMSARKMRPAAAASPNAECRPMISTSSQTARCSSEGAARLGLTTCASNSSIERHAGLPSHTDAPAFALQHGDVEPDAMSDQHRAIRIGLELRPNGRERWRIRDRDIVNAVNLRCGCRNWLVRPHQTRNEATLSISPTARRSAAISTMCAFAGSRPVVSVSMTTASSVMSGVRFATICVLRRVRAARVQPKSCRATRLRRARGGSRQSLHRTS